MRLLITSLARADILESAHFIAKDNIDAAVRFLSETETSIDLIRMTPYIGSPRPVASDESIRMWFVSNFPNYLIFYTVLHGEIKVLRVIHNSRDYTRLLKA